MLRHIALASIAVVAELELISRYGQSEEAFCTIIKVTLHELSG